jgi:hypothetical protein
MGIDDYNQQSDRGEVVNIALARVYKDKAEVAAKKQRDMDSKYSSSIDVCVEN